MNSLPKLSASLREQLLLSLIHSTLDFCFVTNAKRTIQFVNPTVLSRTGFQEDELLGKKDTMLLRKEHRAAYTSHVFKHLTETGEWLGELSFITKQHETLQLIAAVSAMYDTNGKFAGSIVVGHDIKQETIAEQRSWKSDSQLQQIFNAMKDAVLLLDRKGRIVMTNEAFCRMFGCQQEECVGMQLSNSWLDTSEQKHLKQAFKIVEREGTLANYLLTGTKSDNAKIILSCSFSQLKKNTGTKVTYIVSLRDVTNVHYSDELSKTNERLDRLTSEVHLKTSMLEALNEIHRLVLKNASVEKIFRAIIENIRKILVHDLAGIYVFHPDTKEFVPHTMSKQTEFSKLLAQLPLRLGEGIIGTVAKSGKMILVNNAQNDPRSKYPPGMKPEKEHFIAAPLKDKDSLYGILVVARHRNPEFIEEEAQLLKSFADATTIALENVRLVRQTWSESVKKRLSK
ncbi:MAG: PAS domain S-box protein [Ignavibacteriae bacterium]|nr:PAS domain S-box protein [Ignavibacteriota bacterium]